MSADYSQIEMRVLAHLCQDPSMTALFHRDKDIYRQLAGRIMNKPPERVTPEERDKAKVVCLGVLYGMGPQATAAKLGIDVAAANQITHSFFNHFKKMKTWISHIKRYYDLNRLFFYYFSLIIVKPSSMVTYALYWVVVGTCPTSTRPTA